MVKWWWSTRPDNAAGRKEQLAKIKRKKEETKERLDSVLEKAKSKQKSGRKDSERKPKRDSGRKKTDKETRTEREKGKKTKLLVSPGEPGRSMRTGENNMLTRATEKRMEELSQDGIIILIDEPNLEINKGKQMCGERKKEGDNAICRKERWVIRYGRLISVIARGGSGSERRNVLKTCVFTSENSQRVARCRLSKSVQKRYDIEYLVSPVPYVKPKPRQNNSGPNSPKKDKDGEKSVDTMLVRKMVEEYAALDIFRSQGLEVPKRTFCIVSGDSDFVDVAKTAREKGFNVELWFFDKAEVYSPGKWKRVKPGKCESGKCGCFDTVDLDDYTKRISKWSNLEEDRDWSVLSSAREKVEKA